jgi:hypothetical protein
MHKRDYLRTCTYIILNILNTSQITVEIGRKPLSSQRRTRAGPGWKFGWLRTGRAGIAKPLNPLVAAPEKHTKLKLQG